MTTDKYNDEKAISLRKKLQAYGDQISELKYRVYCLTKEAIAVEKEYSEYLGYKVQEDVQNAKS